MGKPAGRVLRTVGGLYRTHAGVHSPWAPRPGPPRGRVRPRLSRPAVKASINIQRASVGGGGGGHYTRSQRLRGREIVFTRNQVKTIAGGSTGARWGGSVCGGQAPKMFHRLAHRSGGGRWRWLWSWWLFCRWCRAARPPHVECHPPPPKGGKSLRPAVTRGQSGGGAEGAAPPYAAGGGVGGEVRGGVGIPPALSESAPLSLPASSTPAPCAGAG